LWCGDACAIRVDVRLLVSFPAYQSVGNDLVS
jgi:hypothetical protein